MENTLILYPCPAMGHLIPMIEFGKLILHHHPSFSITILLLTPPPSSSSTLSISISDIDQYIAEVSSDTPSLTFLHIHPTSPISSTQSREDLMIDLVQFSNPNLHETLQTLSESTKIKALILDMFNYSAMEVAEKFEIPSYFFYTSSAKTLLSHLYLPIIHEATTGNLKDLKVLLEIPGLSSIHHLEFPQLILVRDTKVYKDFLNSSIHMSKSKGIIINTFKCLELKALKAISDGLPTDHLKSSHSYAIDRYKTLIETPQSFPRIKDHQTSSRLVMNHNRLSAADQSLITPLTIIISNKEPNRALSKRLSPMIFTVGPLTSTKVKEDRIDHENYLQWLNSQPSKSVVFLCFGSLGFFTSEQLAAIATGLENIGRRFLWVIRVPPQEKVPHLEQLLPGGFLKRTKQRGMVLTSWASQRAILNHDSVAVFVTHCGWNSILDTVCGGVPMVTWPLYAEQKMNKEWLVEEMQVALPLPVDEREDGFISAVVLEDTINELMGSEKGERVRERVLALREEAMAALEDGGSSVLDLVELAKKFKT